MCVTGGDSSEYLRGVLYYVLLHVLNQYNIQIVGGFQLYAFPGLHTVLICVIDVFQCAHANVLILQIDDQRRGGYVLCMHSENSV